MRLQLLAATAMLSCIALSCSLSKEQTDLDGVAIAPSFKSESICHESEDFVSMSDVKAYLKASELAGDNREVFGITPVMYEDRVVAYRVEFRKGWELISASTRTRALIASDDTSVFPEKEDSPMAAWLRSVYENIYVISNMSEDDINSTFSEDALKKLACYEKEWNAILHPERLLAVPTKVIPGGDGYELIRVETDTVYYDERPHLIDVHWRQSAPFNRFCPLKSNSEWIHAPAGCVAVACSQVLLYLHDKIGIPTEAPDSAYVSGNIYSYTMEQYGSSTTVWDGMRGDIFEEAPSIFVAYVGKMLRTRYGDDASTATASNIVPYCFSPLGIDCHLVDYDSELLSSRLVFGCPAIVNAFESNSSLTGHSFIIDGYRRYQIRHIYYYRKTNPSGSMFQPTYTSTVVELPMVTDYSMNWGWGEGFDNGYYAVHDAWANGGYTFRNRRSMICDYLNALATN